ncbi:MAG: FecR domain-containing protein [Dehalococcoidia bacterium]|nr:FecR domain-containing protein [Dehalococcoidia bacterium]
MKAGTDTWSKASADMTLEAGDSIKTGVFSRAVITFSEGSTIELKADTEVGVTDLSISEDTGSTIIRLWQQIGKTKSRVEKLVDPASRYEIETPAGAAVVRGSEADVTVAADGTTTIDNIEGQWSAIAQGEEQPIPEGKQSTIVPGSPPSIPAPSIDPGAVPGIGGGGGGSGGSSGGGGGKGGGR